jgi:DNA-binding NtrC family response regulator
VCNPEILERTAEIADIRATLLTVQRAAVGLRLLAYSLLTTTNKDALAECVGSTEALEIVGKPYDLDELLTAVRRALASTRDAQQRQVFPPT